MSFHNNYTKNYSHVEAAVNFCYNHEEVNTLLLPFLPCEYGWPRWVRIIIYGALLAYFFVGVAIVSDIFMSAIEFIVSQSKTIPYDIGEEEQRQTVSVDIRIWNPTVANLTLMALGSSAPEILLSVIEICGNNFETGKLGAGTIVGSAAFNLLFISAACVFFVPNGESRRIDIYNVFLITSAFSLFAYIWMLVVLQFITPGVVDIWEALVTLFCFPLLVMIAWWADNKFCINAKKNVRKSLTEKAEEIKIALGLSEASVPKSSLLQSDDHPLYVNGQINPAAVLEFYQKIREYADVTDEEAASLIATKLIETKRHSRLWYRMGACRALIGSAKIQPALNEKLTQVYKVLNEKGGKHLSAPLEPNSDVFRKKAVIEFQAASFSVPESIGTFKVTILRHGKADNEVTVHVSSIEGTAKEIHDYERVDQKVVFEPFVYERQVDVTVVDDNQYEPDESFFLRMTLVSTSDEAVFGTCHTMEITIIDDDKAGELSFSKRGFLVSETSRQVSVEVVRKNGCDGVVSVKWHTIPDPQVGCKHPNPMTGTLSFNHMEQSKFITIPLFQENNESETAETFDVELLTEGIAGGAILGKITKTSVTISNDATYKDTVARVVGMASQEMDIIGSGYTTFKQQMEVAFSVNGGEEDETPGTSAYVMHFITFPWKVLFALIPPPSHCGGWLCFITSLATIGILTAIIGDLASIFGCLIKLEPTITAITFVALGTSLPDTFASMAAAKQDKTADNAIGNVTGSNSVNVFLGLGVPWSIAAIVHASWGGDRKDFKVDAGSLGFSVMIYSVVACIALVFLTVRRNMQIFGCAELGGPALPKLLSAIFLLLLWLIYIILSALQAYNLIEYGHTSAPTTPMPSTTPKP